MGKKGTRLYKSFTTGRIGQCVKIHIIYADIKNSVYRKEKLQVQEWQCISWKIKDKNKLKHYRY